MSAAASGERPAARAQAVRDSLREAFGATVCWVVAEWLLLDMAYLSEGHGPPGRPGPFFACTAGGSVRSSLVD